MAKTLTCIECPVGCSLSIDIENCRVTGIRGNKCPKGEAYGRSEMENPVRVLTSSVLAEGLALKMVPVRTDKPIPKARLMEAMAQVRKARIRRPVSAGDVIIRDLLGLGANLVATRDIRRRD